MICVAEPSALDPSSLILAHQEPLQGQQLAGSIRLSRFLPVRMPMTCTSWKYGYVPAMDGDTAIRFLLSSLPSKKGPMVGSFASTNRTLAHSAVLVDRPHYLPLRAVHARRAPSSFRPPFTRASRYPRAHPAAHSQTMASPAAITSVVHTYRRRPTR